ncbi:2-deoxy-5-keto-D-gluconate 6-phosphate aldolase [Alteribacillus persepolensis]|uniref:2-deoxy-5-keto-D-gluconate 6-phosphate aldolase n=1 Tax=Alteribacillus persepolensis TaxID=568899 RepID=A0A1G8F290_9BACI|nr:class II fructose-1,6-bisphosphate aldolase [Alteribacillus persepolensis]SDH76273.1 2-deoxy-5-keto-D-gluconate 6-phosphate aldolase [Alteribacillus persepolensis]
MTLVSMKEMLTEAKQAGYAVGQYNINNLEFISAFLRVAQEEKSPMIIAASDRMVDFLGGFKNIAAMVKTLYNALDITVPVALHLDHGQSVIRCKQAMDAGFTSVMIDGSHYPIEKNINMTKEVADYANSRGVSVEAEVGTVGGQEDGLAGSVQYADVKECIRLVEETKIDALAAALGSVHGPYKGEPKLGFEQMKEISERTQVPLVLHGGTGIPTHHIQRAITLGHAKINVNTENIQAWTKAVRNKLAEDENVYEPRLILSPAIEAVETSVKEKIREFGTSGKASQAVAK